MKNVLAQFDFQPSVSLSLVYSLMFCFNRNYKKTCNSVKVGGKKKNVSTPWKINTPCCLPLWGIALQITWDWAEVHFPAGQCGKQNFVGRTVAELNIMCCDKMFPQVCCYNEKLTLKSFSFFFCFLTTDDYCVLTTIFYSFWKTSLYLSKCLFNGRSAPPPTHPHTHLECWSLSRTNIKTL